ncbi:MAG: hypothetical protein IPN04_11725 [Rhodoferax sp.]|nr:hypothetical protein [Rhodoferax sp.]
MKTTINKSSTTSDLKDEEKLGFSSLHGTHRVAQFKQLVRLRLNMVLSRFSMTVATTFTAALDQWSNHLGSMTDLMPAYIAAPVLTTGGVSRVTTWRWVLSHSKSLVLRRAIQRDKFADVDQFSSNTSWTGWHARLRYKFDENSLSLVTARPKKSQTKCYCRTSQNRWRCPHSVVTPTVTISIATSMKNYAAAGALFAVTNLG